MTKPYLPLSDEQIQWLKETFERIGDEDVLELIKDRNHWKAEYEALLADAKLCGSYHLWARGLRAIIDKPNPPSYEKDADEAAKRIEAR